MLLLLSVLLAATLVTPEPHLYFAPDRVAGCWQPLQGGVELWVQHPRLALVLVAVLMMGGAIAAPLFALLERPWPCRVAVAVALVPYLWFLLALTGIEDSVLLVC